MLNNGTYSTDWLGLDPIFYNTKTFKASYCINDVIDYSNLEFDENGLCDYLDYGYSVFGNTPVKNVKYTLPNTQLTITENSINSIELADPALSRLGKTTNEYDVIGLIDTLTQNWCDQNDKEIIVPTSSGYDSRFLCSLVPHRKNVHAFSYGISPDQSQSHEVMVAQKVCEILGIKWGHIELGDFHTYNDFWESIFGCSTHLHGMYHAEFYTKIKACEGDNIKVLSGIIGDLWAGNKHVPPIQSKHDLIHLGLNYGVCSTSSECLMKKTIDTQDVFFENNRYLLGDPLYRMLTLIRTKLVLLRYLTLVPQKLGVETWSPFLNIDVAFGMLCLPEDRRINRQWQVEYFEQKQIRYINEQLSVQPDLTNSLDLSAQNRIPLEPLNTGILREVMSTQYLDLVEYNANNLAGYNAKVTLLPLQRLLERRGKQ